MRTFIAGILRILAQELERLKENSSTRVSSYLDAENTEEEEYSVEKRNAELDEEADVELQPLGPTDDINIDTSKADNSTDVASLSAEADNENDSWEITSRRRGGFNKHLSRKAREVKQAKGSQDISMEMSAKNLTSTRKNTIPKPVQDVEERMAHGHSQMTRAIESTASSDSSASTEYPESKIARESDGQTSTKSNGEQTRSGDSATHLQSEEQKQHVEVADPSRGESYYEFHQSNGAESVDNGYHTVNPISSNAEKFSNPPHPEFKNGYSSYGSISKSSNNLVEEHHEAVFVTPPSSKANLFISGYQEQNNGGIPISFMTSSILDWPLQLASSVKSSTESIVYVTPIQRKSTALYAPSGSLCERPVLKDNEPTIANEDMGLEGAQNTVHGGKQ